MGYDQSYPDAIS
jgi:hypothetical protein